MRSWADFQKTRSSRQCPGAQVTNVPFHESVGLDFGHALGSFKKIYMPGQSF